MGLSDIPLVSVIVITYNSASFVLETLESVKRQTYRNVELIISDDCSKDNTFEICEKWLDENRECFVRAKLVSTKNNGGICANYNNGLSHATGEWIKYIAGDDILTEVCISEFVEYATTHTDKILLSGMVEFGDNIDIENSATKIIAKDFDSLSTKHQEMFFINGDLYALGPTLFVETQTLRELNGFDETFPMIEDYPVLMKYLSHGYHIGLVNKPLVLYRVYHESVSRSGNDRFGQSIFAAIDYYAPTAAWRNGMYAYWWHHSLNKWLRGRYHNEWYKRPFVYLLRATDIISWRKKR